MSNNFNWKYLIEILFIAIVLISFLFSISSHTNDSEERITGEEEPDRKFNFVSILEKSELNKSSVPPPNIPV